MTAAPRILAAAMELFGTQGFEQTSIRQIAERCGVTDAAVLYHFGSKRSILTALWKDVLDVSPGDDPEPAATVAEQVDRVTLMTLTDAAMRDAEVRLMLRQTLAGDGDAAEVRTMRVQAWTQSLEDLFGRAYPRVQALQMADALTMLLTGCVLRGQIEHGAAFGEVCRDADFQHHVQQLARTILPLVEREAG